MEYPDIITYKNKNAPLRLGLFFRAGGLFQPTGLEGASHLLEHIIGAKLAELSLDLGFSAFTTKEMIYFTFESYEVDFLDRNLDKIINIITKEKITKEELPQESNVIDNELANFSTDYPNTNQVKLHDFLSTGIFSEGIEGLVEGSTVTRKVIDIAKLEKFRHQFLNTPYSIILVGDDKYHEPSLLALDSMGWLDKGDNAKAASVVNSSNNRLNTSSLGSKVVLRDEAREGVSDGQRYVGVGWKTEYEGIQGYLAQYLLFKSALDYRHGLLRRLRVDLPYIYTLSVDSDILLSRVSIFSLHTTCSLDYQDEVIDEVVNYITNDPNALVASKDLLIKMQKSSESVTDGSENTFNFLSYYRENLSSPEEYIRIIRAMTIDDIMAQRHRFTDSNYAAVIS